ncbi:MAG: ATP-binding protein, partial [Vicinamibacterales bacterium]
TTVAIRSIRTRFQLVVVLLTLAAIGATGWVASEDAGLALREATYDRLTAIRETRRLAIERYFEDLTAHVAALSTSETTLLALREFSAAWPRVADAGPEAPSTSALRDHYRRALAPTVSPTLTAETILADWFPADGRVRTLQYEAIAVNPHPDGAKDLLTDIRGGAAAWGDVHARHHPTFHRYRQAFGFYDIFVISVPDGRVLYSVMKEVDLGMRLIEAPYAETGLGRVYRRIVEAPAGTEAVVEDFSRYLPSGLAPAAFVAAPVTLAGARVGVLAIQLSIREVDRVMTGGHNWREGGFGDTGQAFLVGPDGLLRSDLRGLTDEPERFFGDLAARGVDPGTIASIRDDGTTVLHLPVDLAATERVGASGTEVGVNVRGARVLRSQAPLAVPGLTWRVVAELDADEALAPVAALRARVGAVGVALAAVFFMIAGGLGARVTTPIRTLARAVARLGAGQRGATVDVESADEVGELAAAFNRMSADLARTTVSKAELEVLAGRLISAQEDERRRVARELHDDLVQRVAAAAIEVGLLEHLPPDERARGLADLKRTLATLSVDVHNLSRRIHPAMLEERGLVGSIEAECRAFMERGGLPVDLRVPAVFEPPRKDVALAAYRIVQEALRNAAQHAATATEITVTLARTDTDLVLEVADDGAGFDRGAPGWKAGLGLASMEERVRLLGGTLEIASRVGSGTRIRATLPLGTD